MFDSTCKDLDRQKNLAGRTLVSGVAQRVDLELQMGYGGMWWYITDISLIPAATAQES